MKLRENLLGIGAAAAIVAVLAALVVGGFVGAELWTCRGDGARTCRFCTETTGGLLAFLRPRVCGWPG